MKGIPLKVKDVRPPKETLSKWELPWNRFPGEGYWGRNTQNGVVWGTLKAGHDDDRTCLFNYPETKV